MTASVWNPAGSTANVANADNNYKHQVFIVDAPTVLTGIFILTDFTYQIGTESLLVLVNGVDQVLTTDYTETSNNVVTIPGVKLGDEIVIRALVGSTASQSAAASAAQASADAAATHADYLATLALTPTSLPLPVNKGGTGQITKAAGFIALAPVAQAKKVIGSLDGINFSAMTQLFSVTEYITTSGTWIAGSDTTLAEITVIAGGATGFVPGGGSFRPVAGGGSGKSIALRNITPGGSYTCIVGAGGAAISPSGGPNPGTLSSFTGPGVSIITVPGCLAPGNNLGGAAGTGGDINLAGDPGGGYSGAASESVSPNAGSSPLGGAGIAGGPAAFPGGGSATNSAMNSCQKAGDGLIIIKHN